jgi:hypothetical protein
VSYKGNFYTGEKVMNLWPSKKQWKSWTLPSKLAAIGVLSTLVLGIVAIIVTIILHCFSTEQSKHLQLQLDDLFVEKHEKDLQSKYPGGYILFGIDHSRGFENHSTPHGSNVLEEYEFDWDPVKISEVTENNVTIEFPDIHYKLQGTEFINTAMVIPKSPKGVQHRYPLRPKGAKNRIFCELVEYKDSFYVFAIGFKHVEEDK